jgi:hypothetical protein
MMEADQAAEIVAFNWTLILLIAWEDSSAQYIFLTILTVTLVCTLIVKQQIYTDSVFHSFSLTLKNYNFFLQIYSNKSHGSNL